MGRIGGDCGSPSCAQLSPEGVNDPRATRRIPRTGELRGAVESPPVELELSPEQPAEVVQALAGLLESAPPAPDPWWRAGIVEALET